MIRISGIMRFKTVCIIAVTILAVLFLAGTVSETGRIDPKQEAAKEAYRKANAVSQTGWSALGQETAVLENESFRFELDGESTHITLTDKTSGAEYFSKPKKEEYPISPLDYARMDSVIAISYYASDSQWYYMGSRFNSVNNGDYQIEKKDNSIRVIYKLSDASEAWFVPQVFDQDTFENKLFANTTATGKRWLPRFYKLYSSEDPPEDYEERKKQYPQLEKQALYLLDAAVHETSYEQIHKIMEDSNFTREDYQKMLEALGLIVEERPQSSFSIAVEYTLNKDGFTASILNNTLTQTNPDDQVYEIYFLENFLSCLPDENGYYLVPDGSGALIKTKSDKVLKYSQPLYGEDTNSTYDIAQVTENAMLPVYGIKQGNSGMLAVVEKAAASAVVYAELQEDMNKLYSVFRRRALDVSNIGSSHGMSDIHIFAKEEIRENPTIRFLFLPEGQNTYSHMAGRYRSYLTEKDLLTKSADTDVSLYADYLGAAQPAAKGALAGQVILSKASGIESTAAWLHEKGIAVAVRLRGFGKDGLETMNLSDFSLNRKTGTPAQFASLAESLRAYGGELWLDRDISIVYREKNFDSYKKSIHTARRLNKTLFTASDYDLVTLKKVSGLNKRLMVTPGIYEQTIRKLLTRMPAKELSLFDGISWGSAGSELYGDYNTRFVVDRNLAVRYIQDALEAIKEQGKKRAVNLGMGYTIGYTETIVGLPVKASDFETQLRSVPFIQMVLHGSVVYTAGAVNLSADPELYWLQCAETGSLPYVCWITESSLLLKQTAYRTHWYTLNDRAQIDEIQKGALWLSELLGPVKGKAILSHDVLENGLVRVRYENDVEILINYSDRKLTLGNDTLAPKSAVRREGDANHEN